MQKCACCHHIIKKVSLGKNVYRINFTWLLIHFEPLFLQKKHFPVEKQHVLDLGGKHAHPKTLKKWDGNKKTLKHVYIMNPTN